MNRLRAVLHAAVLPVNYTGRMVGPTGFEPVDTPLLRRLRLPFRHGPLEIGTAGGIRTPNILVLDQTPLPVGLRRYTMCGLPVFGFRVGRDARPYGLAGTHRDWDPLRHALARVGGVEPPAVGFGDRSNPAASLLRKMAARRFAASASMADGGTPGRIRTLDTRSRIPVL